MPKLWEERAKTWSAKTTPFASRVNYGDLLLAADKGAEAEKLFRELYQLAGNQADLTTAIEGIAKSLRRGRERGASQCVPDQPPGRPPPEAIGHSQIAPKSCTSRRAFYSFKVGSCGMDGGNERGFLDAFSQPL